MSQNTAIQWTDATWNPVRGCSIVSKGCTHCYAMKQAHRFNGAGQAYEGLTKMTNGGPVWTGDIRLVPEKLEEPLRWKRPRRVFVNSMSDLFHEDVPFEFIASVFAIMGVTTRHTYQILTKRPDRMLSFFKWAHQVQDDDGKWCEVDADDFDADRRIFSRWPESIPWKGYDNCGPRYPYENVWLGVSVEDQATADERIPLLLETPAAVRWVSYEPALGPVNFQPYLRPVPNCRHVNPLDGCCDFPGSMNAECHRFVNCPSVGARWGGIDWVVVGGESGPGARPFDVQWARYAVADCDAAEIPVFVKQVGGNVRDSFRLNGRSRPDADWPPHTLRGHDAEHGGVFLNSRKGDNMDEWPRDIRVRQYPEPQPGAPR